MYPIHSFVPLSSCFVHKLNERINKTIALFLSVHSFDFLPSIIENYVRDQNIYI